jgi:hypothetical protein
MDNNHQGWSQDDLTRYKFKFYSTECDCHYVPDTNGEWVKFDDIKEFLKTHTNKQSDSVKKEIYMISQIECIQNLVIHIQSELDEINKRCEIALNNNETDANIKHLKDEIVSACNIAEGGMEFHPLISLRNLINKLRQISEV